jgi:hypothetical protein
VNIWKTRLLVVAARTLLVAGALLGTTSSSLLPVAPASIVAASPGLATADPAPKGSTGGPEIGLYRGLGTWIDIYDDPAWADPEGTVGAMAANRVRTLYIETSNYRRKKDIKFLSKQYRFIEAAHAAGMRVVAWYLPGFRDLRKDFRRTMAAIKLRTPNGQSFDSFGLDIEAPLVADPYRRTKRLLTLSARIREAVGRSYPLGAIIPSPRGIERNPTYWPGFPYRELAQRYDVFLPMTYFTWRVSGKEGAHRYTQFNIRIIRKKTGIRNVPIHVIGGIADESTVDETRGFVHALREHGILGGSYYTFPLTSAAQWRVLRTIPANPRQNPALPTSAGTSAKLGNIKGADRTHPKEVVYRVGGLSGVWALKFSAFDVQAREVALFVNWRRVKMLKPTSVDAWSGARVVRIPEDFLRHRRENYIQFVARGSYPSWRQWGIRVAGFAKL